MKVRKKARGVSLDMVKEDLLEEKLKELDLEFDSTDSLASKVGVFMDYMDAQIGLLKKTGGSIGLCEQCNASCDLKWPSCPVCGTNYDDDAVLAPETTPEATAVQLVEELDQAVVKIKALVVDSMSNYHKLGRNLLDVFRSGLYKTRVVEGKPKYRSWDEFVETEIGISGVRGRTIMDVADQFTEEQVVKLGVEKLRIVSRFENDERKDLIEKAASMSTRALAVAAAEIRQKLPPKEEGAGDYVEEIKKTAGLKLGTEAAKKAREERKAIEEEHTGVTAVFQMGEYELELFKTGKLWTARHPLVNDVVCLLEVNLNSKPPRLTMKINREKA